MFLILGLNVLPCVLTIMIWFAGRKEMVTLPKGRSVVFICGLVATLVSSAFLIVFVVREMIRGHGAGSSIAGAYLFFSMFGLGLLGAVLALSGTRISRPLLVANGVFVAALWYMAVMASSI